MSLNIQVINLWWCLGFLQMVVLSNAISSRSIYQHGIHFFLSSALALAYLAMLNSTFELVFISVSAPERVESLSRRLLSLRKKTVAKKNSWRRSTRSLKLAA